MGIKTKNKKEKYNKIMKIKIGSTIDFLCGKLPKEFIDFMQYIKSLQFEDKPNYQYLKTLLGKMYDKNNFTYDMIFDFTDILIKKENGEIKGINEKEEEKEENNNIIGADKNKPEIKEEDKKIEDKKDGINDKDNDNKDLKDEQKIENKSEHKNSKNS